MQTHDLAFHPDFPPLAVRCVWAAIDASHPHWLALRWRIDGASAIIVPPFAGRARRDELWRTTCFELFARAPGAADYLEYNFSPSQAWAAYGFNGYRAGMVQREIRHVPVADWRGGASGLALFDARIARSDLPPPPWEYQMTAVIEEVGGRKSYWAVTHPQGPPDFHDPTCFAATLAAPEVS